MKLECTKKLLDFLGEKPGKGLADPDADPLFSWTANLILLNRRKTIVITHVVSHATFVLYGITAKDLRNIQELILEGMENLLKSMYVRQEIIELYLRDCGRSVEFAANTSRSAVATCNKVCERVQYLTNLFDPGDPFQKPYLKWLNADLIPKEDYAYVTDFFLSLLRKKYGAEIQRCRAVKLEVTLELLTPCKRTLIVPADLNFHQFHTILQKAFGWRDCHLHQFILKNDSYGRPSKLIVPPNVERFDYMDGTSPEYIDSSKITLENIFSSYEHLQYEYDFGDSWTHHIKVKGFIDLFDNVHPHCTEAEGDAPMEDSGGPYNFAEIMDILNQPDHPEYKDTQNWVRSTFWHPLDFNRINAELKYYNPMPIPVYYG